MPRLPYEHFIRYLITLDHTYQEINRTLGVYGFSVIDEPYFAQLKAEIDLPPGFRGRDRRHAASIQCLRRNAITELWFKEEYSYVAKAFDILGKPSVRRIVDTLAATPATFDEIALALRERLGYAVNTDTIMFYTRIFCNYALLTPEELREYAKLNKKYWLAAAVAGDVQLLKYHLGLKVHLKVQDVVQDIFQIGAMKIKELRHRAAGLENARSFGEYVSGIQWSVEQMQGSQDQLGDLTKALKMHYDDESSDPQYEEATESADIRSIEANEGREDAAG